MAEQDRVIAETIERVLEQNLALDTSESYLYFTDFPSVWEEDYESFLSRRAFLHSFYEAFGGYCDRYPNRRNDKYESTGRHGSEPGENIWRLAFGDRIYEALDSKDLIWKLKVGHTITRSETEARA